MKNVQEIDQTTLQMRPIPRAGLMTGIHICTEKKTPKLARLSQLDLVSSPLGTQRFHPSFLDQTENE